MGAGERSGLGGAGSGLPCIPIAVLGRSSPSLLGLAGVVGLGEGAGDIVVVAFVKP